MRNIKIRLIGKGPEAGSAGSGLLNAWELYNASWCL